MSLREMQTAFMSCLFAGSAAVRPEAAALSDPARLAIYRNNVYTALTRALAESFPVIVRLVGEGFFKFTAGRYIDTHPSRSGDLNRFGADFAAFLGTFAPAAALPYLADTARLEWSAHECYLAADDVPLDLSALAAVPPDAYPGLRFRLSHASRLLRSAWPVERIWHVNQAGFDGDQSVDMDSGGVRLLIQRRANRIALIPLSEAEWRFLTAIQKQRSLETAYARALAADTAADLGALLTACVARDTLVEFFL